MNRNSEGAWSQAGGLAAVNSMHDQDFNVNDLLDFESFDTFSPFETAQDGPSQNTPHTAASEHPVVRDGWRNDDNVLGFQHDMSQFQNANGSIMANFGPGSASFTQLQHQDSMDHIVMSNDGYQHHQAVPPTPNSSQMYPNSLTNARNLEQYVKQNGGRFTFNPNDPVSAVHSSSDLHVC